MNSSLLLRAVAIIAALTTVTVEGVKTLLDKKEKTYSANMLAVIVSFTITIIGSILYIVYFAIPVTGQVIVVIICLVFLSFLTATVGYDKIKQLIEQLMR